MRRIITAILAAAIGLSCAAKNPPQVAGLLDRIGGEGTAKRFETQVKESISEDGKDVFIIGSKKGKPFIQGSSMSALTAGIGWYLNHYAHINLSWNNLTTDLSAVELPVPAKSERRECSAEYRYYMNYCTYSYSMAFWTQKRWEQEIDWMALHGINLPLALIGTDVVWKNMLEEMGYTREEINRFVAGPGFHAWWLMSNLEGWGGENPDWWYLRQEKLCKFVQGRMRELGMSPVLPGFGGMLPSNAAEKMGVDAIYQGYWCSGFRRPSFLLPTDEKFDDIAAMYYKHVEKIMGSAKYYSMDPFHEGGLTKGVDLKAAYGTIYSEMVKNSPGSKWVLQSWGHNPRKEALEGVPVGGFIILDLFSEGRPRWQSGYDGHEFIWCMLHNFGGKLGIQGRLDATLNGFSEASGKFPSNAKGVGATPEGIETNPILYDAVFEVPWLKPEERAGWTASWSEARYGQKSENMEQAWEIMRKTILDGPMQQQSDIEAVVCARPELDVKKVSGWGTSRLYHDIQAMRKAAALMLSEKERFGGHPNYRYDVTDAVRQALNDSTYTLLQNISSCYKKGDKEGFRTGYRNYLSMIKDIDRLLSQSDLFTLDRWVNSARAICDEVEGTTEADRDWLEWNARTLVSVWGPEKSANHGRLHDYSHRLWGGMLRDFYLVRWEMFFKALDEGRTITPEEWFRFEYDWSCSNTISKIEAEDAEDVAEELFRKHFTL